MQDVEERRVARADQAVAVDVRVRRAAFAGDRVDPLDVLAAEVVEHLADQADALVLPHARAQEPVQRLVGRVDHRARLGQQRDLVGRLDPAGLQEDLLAVDHLDAGRAQRAQDRHLDDVDADRLAGQAVLGQLGRDLAGDLLGDARVGVERAAQCGDAGPRPIRCRPATGCTAGGAAPRTRSPTAIGSPAARQHREADQLVHRPGADVRRGHVSDVGEVEAQQRAEARTGRARRPAAAADRHAAGQDRPAAPSQRRWSHRCESPWSVTSVSRHRVLGPYVR